MQRRDFLAFEPVVINHVRKKDGGKEGHGRRADDGRAIEAQTHLEIIYALLSLFSFMN